MTPLQGLLSSSAAATFLAAAFAGSSASGPIKGDQAAAASIGQMERHSEFCVRNATDSLIHYSVEWGGSQEDIIAPGATLIYSGLSDIHPAIAFDNLGGALSESYRLELAPSTSDTRCSAIYAFRYAAWSGVAAMKGRTGYFLFGPGIASDAYKLPEVEVPEITRVEYEPIQADLSYAYDQAPDYESLTDWGSEPADSQALPASDAIGAANPSGTAQYSASNPLALGSSPPEGAAEGPGNENAPEVDPAAQVGPQALASAPTMP
jgi:hypothetical protein